MIYELYCESRNQFCRQLIKLCWAGYKETMHERCTIKGRFRYVGKYHLVIFERKDGELKELLFKEDTILRVINPGVN